MFSYHNHSSWSDGQASIREMAEAARAAGVEEFGISDHLVLGPREFYLDARLWSMGVNELSGYMADAQAVKAELDSPGFRVRIGLEVDYFPESVDRVNSLLSGMPLDYVIGAVHFAGNFPIDSSAVYWENLSESERDSVWRSYVRLMGECARRLDCSWLAHLDLPKKFGFQAPEDCVESMETLLDECASLGMLVEINTAGADKACGEFYPSKRLLMRAVASGVGLLVNADAHEPSQVARHFGEARRMLRELGVTKVAGFESRHCNWHSL